MEEKEPYLHDAGDAKEEENTAHEKHEETLVRPQSRKLVHNGRYNAFEQPELSRNNERGEKEEKPR